MRRTLSIHFKSILIIADIEGTSGCWSYSGSSFMTKAWYTACVEMTRDVNVVVKALFHAGVRRITVQDFHRTGYNLLPELIDSRARVLSGYRHGPVPGIGDPRDAKAVMFLGMHAASGSDGFLAHTLTSRIKQLKVNGRLLAEVELFSASLAPYGVRPVFFSGCPIACSQATEVITGIDVYPIDKTIGPKQFDTDSWRAGLASAAVTSLGNITTKPHVPEGPLKAVITMRDGKKSARNLARRWGFNYQGAQIFLEASDMHKLYEDLIRLCYLTPLVEKIVPFALFWYGVKGRIGLEIVRRQVRQKHLLA
jgi:D-amino peptidase